MVRGLEKFKEYFKGYENNYVVIGGTACDIILSDAGLTPRTTKDIDLVIVVEALSKEFVGRFWEFVAAGEYGVKEKGMEERKHYRFSKPATENFPYQVELFSRIPDLIELGKEMHLTPLPVADGLSSLSAILMNSDYYDLTISQSTTLDGIRHARDTAIICLKVKAFQDLTARKKNGESISDSEIKKHKLDVFRVATVLTEDTVVTVPPAVRTDVQDFVDQVRQDLPGPDVFKALGTGPIQANDLVKQIEWTFGLDHDVGAHTDRRIKALKRNLTGKDVATIRLDAKVLGATITNSVVPLLKELEAKCKDLQQDLFNDFERQITMQVAGQSLQVGADKDTPWPELETSLLSGAAKQANHYNQGIDYNYQLRGFKKNLTYNMMTAWLQFQFNEYSYSIRINQDWPSAKNYSYDSPLDKTEIDLIVRTIMDRLIEQISEAGGLIRK